MDAERFDGLCRSLVTYTSRRRILSALSAAAISAGSAGLPGRASAKKKKRKLQLNALGCVDVGGKCRGKNGVCCSGICGGKGPKKGGKDRSRCVAHNTGGCLAAEQGCGPNPDIPCGVDGLCLATTGNAGFCGRVAQAACAACRRDLDCSGFGAGAACVICANGSCPQTGDRACVPAAA